MINLTKSLVDTNRNEWDIQNHHFNVLKCLPETYYSRFIVTCKLFKMHVTQDKLANISYKYVLFQNIKSNCWITNEGKSFHRDDCVYKNIHREVNSLSQGPI